MKHLRKIVMVILTVLLSCQSVSLAQLSPKSSDDNVAVKFRKNVFQLTVEFSNGDMRDGFGFVVGEQGKKLYVVTAAHVVLSDGPDIKTEEILVRFYENRGKSCKAELLDLSYPGLDMAMLEVPRPSEDYVWERKYFFSRPKRNDKVWFIGKNREWYIPTEAGVGYITKPPLISEIHAEMYSVQPGTSGAPLIAKEGIVGMIIEDDGFNVVALNIDTVRQVIVREWKYAWGLQEFQSKDINLSNIEKATTHPIEQKDLDNKKKIEISIPRYYPSKSNQITNFLGMKFVLIPTGTFMMGSPENDKDRKFDEFQHEVKLANVFYMQTTEVTLKQWRYFISETKFVTDAEKGNGAAGWTGSKWENNKKWYWENPGFKQTDEHPVTCVSWNDVQGFITWLNKKDNNYLCRLPTEAEWEYVAKIDAKKYAGGDNINSIAWYKLNSYGTTHSVKTKKGNSLGIYDMSGNVREWCQDWYNSKYYKISSAVNPLGPSSGKHRNLRGCAWNRDKKYCRSAYRDRDFPESRAVNRGFRLVCSILISQSAKRR